MDTKSVKTTDELITDSGKKFMYRAIQTRGSKTFWYPKEFFADNVEDAKALATAEGYDFDDLVKYIRDIQF